MGLGYLGRNIRGPKNLGNFPENNPDRYMDLKRPLPYRFQAWSTIYMERTLHIFDVRNDQLGGKPRIENRVMPNFEFSYFGK